MVQIRAFWTICRANFKDVKMVLQLGLFNSMTFNEPIGGW